MNRVVLCGRLAGRPKLAYTPGGIAVAEFRLYVARRSRSEPDDPPDEAVDCVAFRELAQELVRWGDRDYRVNLDGRLRRDTYWGPDGRQLQGLRVHLDHGYFVDPVHIGVADDLGRIPNVPMPVAIPAQGA